eukprot:677657-Prorocentrum_lima.AAC.1
MVALSSASTSSSTFISNRSCRGRFCVGQAGFHSATRTMLIWYTSASPGRFCVGEDGERHAPIVG